MAYVDLRSPSTACSFIPHSSSSAVPIKPSSKPGNLLLCLIQNRPPRCTPQPRPPSSWPPSSPPATPSTRTRGHLATAPDCPPISSPRPSTPWARAARSPSGRPPSRRMTAMSRTAPSPRAYRLPVWIAIPTSILLTRACQRVKGVAELAHQLSQRPSQHRPTHRPTHRPCRLSHPLVHRPHCRDGRGVDWLGPAVGRTVQSGRGGQDAVRERDGADGRGVGEPELRCRAPGRRRGRCGSLRAGRAGRGDGVSRVDRVCARSRFPSAFGRLLFERACSISVSLYSIETGGVIIRAARSSSRSDPGPQHRGALAPRTSRSRSAGSGCHRGAPERRRTRPCRRLRRRSSRWRCGSARR